jgi:hypothetical protein
MAVMKKIYPVILILVLFSADLCSQNKKADGYKGLWYNFRTSYEHGYKYAGGLATFSSQHNPMAIHSPQVKKTFFVYCGTADPELSHLQIMISYFDHNIRKVARPVIVHDKMGVSDPQDNASLSIDRRGYIWVFVSGRNRTRPGYVFRSDRPWSIENFSQVLRDELLFPQAWWIDTSFMLMHAKSRGGTRLYWSRSGDGQKWTTPAELARMGGHHHITNVLGNRLYSAFSWSPKGNVDARTNIYLVYTGDMGKTWNNIEDFQVQVPLKDTVCDALVKDFHSEKKLVYLNDLNFDSAGNPVILAIISSDFRPGPAGEPREWTVIHRKDNTWQFTKVCDLSHNYNMGSIYTGEKEWRIIGPSDPGPQKYGMGGEMVLWTSTDQGITWKKSDNITSGSSFNNAYARRPVNQNKDFYAFWADGDTEKISESRLYFTNEKCNKVWVLPYEMKKDFEKPLRVK